MKTVCHISGAENIVDVDSSAVTRVVCIISKAMKGNSFLVSFVIWFTIIIQTL